LNKLALIAEVGMSGIALLMASAMVIVMATGCLQVQPQPVPPTSFTSWSPMGSFSMSSGANCAGHATLDHSPTVISDACFTSGDNVVLCTDTTAAAAVGCTPAAGNLTILGTAGDTITYARVR
jgi:hypothetical protein